MIPPTAANHDPARGNPLRADEYTHCVVPTELIRDRCFDYAYSAVFWWYGNVYDKNHDNQGDAYEPVTAEIGCKVGVQGDAVQDCRRSICSGPVETCLGLCPSTTTIQSCVTGDNDSDTMPDAAEFVVCGFPVARTGLDTVPDDAAGSCAGSANYNPPDLGPAFDAGRAAVGIAVAATVLAIGTAEETRDDLDADGDRVPDEAEGAFCTIYHDGLNNLYRVC